MKRWLLRLGIGLPALVLVLVVLATMFAGSIVRNAVNRAGPGLLGVPVTLKDARVRLLAGKVELEGLHIGNPQGYKTPGMFDLGRLDIAFDPGSTFSDTFVIRKINIAAPEITYERGLRNSNVGALLDQMTAGKGAAPAATNAPAPAGGTEASADKGKGRKVVIDELVMSGGRINLSITLAQGHSAPIAMETVTLRNIGREGGTEGVNVIQITRILVGTILRSVLTAVGGAGKMVGDGVGAVGGLAADGANALGAAASRGIEGAGKAATKAIGSLFGGGDDKKPKDEKK